MVRFVWSATLTLSLGFAHSLFLANQVFGENSISKSFPKPDELNTKFDKGFFAIAFQADEGTVLCKINAQQLGKQFLMVTSLESGMGSNPVGLDRGQIRSQRLVYWERVGRKAILRQANTNFRASGTDAERIAVQQSFASSVLFVGKVVAEDKPSFVVDITKLLVADSDGIARQLQSAGEDGYRLDSERSFPSPAELRSFPKNNELAATLTFASEKPGKLASYVTPEPTAVSLEKRLSFIELPELGEYQTRSWHPNCGAFDVDYLDYSAGISEPMHKHLLTRHRCSKNSPIIYYVDHAAPPAVRQALIEGASWWTEAFDEAGLKGLFQVREMPADMDPLDARHNVIQWVHRRTRGWSYGNSIVDPRTGEILKGHVSLGSLRVRQDHRILDSLASPPGISVGNAACCQSCGGGHGHLLAALPALADKEMAVATALDRIRQLSAHEVGHTLGFAHNFAASTYGRASVMDYPAPKISLDEAGNIDTQDAYGKQIGVWDKWVVKYAYGPANQLESLLKISREKGYIYLTDADARPAAACDPRAALWDNGSDAIAELRNLLKIRKKTIESFGLDVLHPEEPVTNLEVNLVPVLLMHRYQIDAVAKLIGGRTYSRGLRKDFKPADNLVSDVPVERQRAALAVLLDSIHPTEIQVPDRIVRQLTPAATSSSLIANALIRNPIRRSTR